VHGVALLSLVAVAVSRLFFRLVSLVCVAVGIIPPPKSEKPLKAKFEPLRIDKKKTPRADARGGFCFIGF
jgi:hypothetical protein